MILFNSLDALSILSHNFIPVHSVQLQASLEIKLSTCYHLKFSYFRRSTRIQEVFTIFPSPLTRLHSRNIFNLETFPNAPELRCKMISLKMGRLTTPLDRVIGGKGKRKKSLGSQAQQPPKFIPLGRMERESLIWRTRHQKPATDSNFTITPGHFIPLGGTSFHPATYPRGENEASRSAH